MKTPLQLTKKYLTPVLLSITFIFGCSCSSDSEEPEALEEVVISNDVTLSIDEYPRSGDLVTQLKSNLEGQVTYNIVQQTLSDAMIVNGNSVFVGDWLAFDFEINPQLTADIVAANGTETENIKVTVDINDVDDIEAFLVNSKEVYQNAADGEWIPILENEYNDLANYLQEVTKSGQIDAVFELETQIFEGGADFSVAINNAPALPSGSYIYAFKYHTFRDETIGSNVKLSETSYQDNFVTIGEDLPTHDRGFNFFVLKGNASATNTAAFLGMYESNTIGFQIVNGTSYFFEEGDSSSISKDGFTNRAYLYQALSTTTKQW